MFVSPLDFVLNFTSKIKSTMIWVLILSPGLWNFFTWHFFNFLSFVVLAWRIQRSEALEWDFCLDSTKGIEIDVQCLSCFPLFSHARFSLACVAWRFLSKLSERKAGKRGNRDNKPQRHEEPGRETLHAASSLRWQRRIFISTVPVLPSALIRYDNWAFRERSSNWNHLKTIISFVFRRSFSQT